MNVKLTPSYPKYKIKDGWKEWCRQDYCILGGMVIQNMNFVWLILPKEGSSNAT